METYPGHVQQHDLDIPPHYLFAPPNYTAKLGRDRSDCAQCWRKFWQHSNCGLYSRAALRYGLYTLFVTVGTIHFRHDLFAMYLLVPLTAIGTQPTTGQSFNISVHAAIGNYMALLVTYLIWLIFGINNLSTFLTILIGTPIIAIMFGQTVHPIQYRVYVAFQAIYLFIMWFSEGTGRTIGQLSLVGLFGYGLAILFGLIPLALTTSRHLMVRTSRVLIKITRLMYLIQRSALSDRYALYNDKMATHGTSFQREKIRHNVQVALAQWKGISLEEQLQQSKRHHHHHHHAHGSDHTNTTTAANVPHNTNNNNNNTHDYPSLDRFGSDSVPPALSRAPSSCIKPAVPARSRAVTRANKYILKPLHDDINDDTDCGDISSSDDDDHDDGDADHIRNNDTSRHKTNRNYRTGTRRPLLDKTRSRDDDDDDDLSGSETDILQDIDDDDDDNSAINNDNCSSSSSCSSSDDACDDDDIVIETGHDDNEMIFHQNTRLASRPHHSRRRHRDQNKTVASSDREPATSLHTPKRQKPIKHQNLSIARSLSKYKDTQNKNTKLPPFRTNSSTRTQHHHHDGPIMHSLAPEYSSTIGAATSYWNHAINDSDTRPYIDIITTEPHHQQQYGHNHYPHYNTHHNTDSHHHHRHHHHHTNTFEHDRRVVKEEFLGFPHKINMPLYKPRPEIHIAEAEALIDDISKDLATIQSLVNELNIESLMYRFSCGTIFCCIQRYYEKKQQQIDNNSFFPGPHPLYPPVGSPKLMHFSPYSPASVVSFCNELSSSISNARSLVATLRSFHTLSEGGIALYHMHTHFMEKDMRRTTKLFKALVVNACQKNPDLKALDGAFIQSILKLRKQGSHIDIFATLYHVLSYAHRNDAITSEHFKKDAHHHTYSPHHHVNTTETVTTTTTTIPTSPPHNDERVDNTSNNNHTDPTTTTTTTPVHISSLPTLSQTYSYATPDNKGLYASLHQTSSTDRNHVGDGTAGASIRTSHTTRHHRGHTPSRHRRRHSQHHPNLRTLKSARVPNPHYVSERLIRSMSFAPGTYAAVLHSLRNFWIQYSVIRKVSLFGKKGIPPLFVLRPANAASSSSSSTSSSLPPHLPHQIPVDLSDRLLISSFFFNYDRFITRLLHFVLPHSLTHMYPLIGIQTTMVPSLLLPDDHHGHNHDIQPQQQQQHQQHLGQEEQQHAGNHNNDHHTTTPPHHPSAPKQYNSPDQYHLNNNQANVYTASQTSLPLSPSSPMQQSDIVIASNPVSSTNTSATTLDSPIIDHHDHDPFDLTLPQLSSTSSSDDDNTRPRDTIPLPPGHPPPSPQYSRLDRHGSTHKGKDRRRRTVYVSYANDDTAFSGLVGVGDDSETIIPIKQHQNKMKKNNKSIKTADSGTSPHVEITGAQTSSPDSAHPPSPINSRTNSSTLQSSKQRYDQSTPIQYPPLLFYTKPSKPAYFTPPPFSAFKSTLYWLLTPYAFKMFHTFIEAILCPKRTPLNNDKYFSASLDTSSGLVTVTTKQISPPVPPPSSQPGSITTSNLPRSQSLLIQTPQTPALVPAMGTDGGTTPHSPALHMMPPAHIDLSVMPSVADIGPAPDRQMGLYAPSLPDLVPLSNTIVPSSPSIDNGDIPAQVSSQRSPMTANATTTTTTIELHDLHLDINNDTSSMKSPLSTSQRPLVDSSTILSSSSPQPRPPSQQQHDDGFPDSSHPNSNIDTTIPLPPSQDKSLHVISPRSSHVTASSPTDTLLLLPPSPPSPPQPQYAPLPSFCTRVSTSWKTHIMPNPGTWSMYQNVCRSTAAILLASALGLIPSSFQSTMHRIYWSAMTAGLLASDNTGGNIAAVYARIKGVIIGAFLGMVISIIALHVDPQLESTGPWIMGIFIGFYTMLVFYYSQMPNADRAAAGGSLTTISVICLGGIDSGSDGHSMALLRVEMSLLGAVSVLITGFLFFPKRTETTILNNMSRIMKQMNTCIQMDFLLLESSLKYNWDNSVHYYGASIFPALIVYPKQDSQLPSSQQSQQEHNSISGDTTTTTITPATTNSTNAPMMTYNDKINAEMQHPFTLDSKLRVAFAKAFPGSTMPKDLIPAASHYDKTLQAKLAEIRSSITGQTPLIALAQSESGLTGTTLNRLGHFGRILDAQTKVLRIIARLHECILIHQWYTLRLPKVKDINTLHNTIEPYIIQQQQQHPQTSLPSASSITSIHNRINHHHHIPHFAPLASSSTTTTTTSPLHMKHFTINENSYINNGNTTTPHINPHLIGSLAIMDVFATYGQTVISIIGSLMTILETEAKQTIIETTFGFPISVGIRNIAPSKEDKDEYNKDMYNKHNKKNYNKLQSNGVQQQQNVPLLPSSSSHGMMTPNRTGIVFSIFGNHFGPCCIRRRGISQSNTIDDDNNTLIDPFTKTPLPSSPSSLEADKLYIQRIETIHTQYIENLKRLESVHSNNNNSFNNDTHNTNTQAHIISSQNTYQPYGTTSTDDDNNNNNNDTLPSFDKEMNFLSQRLYIDNITSHELEHIILYKQLATARQIRHNYNKLNLYWLSRKDQLEHIVNDQSYLIRHLFVITENVIRLYQATCDDRVKATTSGQTALYPTGFILIEQNFIHCLSLLPRLLIELMAAVSVIRPL